jgi:hypothetical protein
MAPSAGITAVTHSLSALGYRKRLATTNLRVATRRERKLIEEAGHGRLNDHEQGPRCLSAAIDAYLTAKRIRCSPRTIELASMQELALSTLP